MAIRHAQTFVFPVLMAVGTVSTLGLLPAGMTATAKAEPGPEGCSDSAWVCSSPAIPTSAEAKKLNGCLTDFFANKDVFQECFTEDFVGTAPDFSMSYETLGKPGHEYLERFQRGALYDVWFWRSLTYKPTLVLHQGNQWFFDTLWEGAGPKNAAPGTPFCKSGSEPTCMGYFQPVEARVDGLKIRMWHLIETRDGKISRWTVNYDLLLTHVNVMKDLETAKALLGMTATMLKNPASVETMLNTSH